MEIQIFLPAKSKNSLLFIYRYIIYIRYFYKVYNNIFFRRYIPLIGFFAKQMVLSAALDNGYIFITLTGILTSILGSELYYLSFQFKPSLF